MSAITLNYNNDAHHPNLSLSEQNIALKHYKGVQNFYHNYGAFGFVTKSNEGQTHTKKNISENSLSDWQCSNAVQ